MDTILSMVTGRADVMPSAQLSTQRPQLPLIRHIHQVKEIHPRSRSHSKTKAQTLHSSSEKQGMKEDTKQERITKKRETLRIKCNN